MYVRREWLLRPSSYAAVYLPFWSPLELMQEDNSPPFFSDIQTFPTLPRSLIRSLLAAIQPAAASPPKKRVYILTQNLSKASSDPVRKLGPNIYRCHYQTTHLHFEFHKNVEINHRRLSFQSKLLVNDGEFRDLLSWCRHSVLLATTPSPLLRFCRAIYGPLYMCLAILGKKPGWD